MSTGQRFLPVLGFVVAGVAAFAVGVSVMGQKSAEDTPAAAAPTRAAPAAKPAAVDPAPREPEMVEAPKETPAAPSPGRLPPSLYDPKTNLPLPQKSVRGRWEKMSGYALPNPRRLRDEEKAALALLGGALDLHSYKFSSVTLDDGSTIPGLPPLTDAEVRDHVLGKIRARGLADGFEEAIRSLAVHNPNQVTVLVAQQADWAAVEKALGITAQLHPGKGTSMYYRQGGRTITYCIQWISSGWLRFGVDAGKVRMIGAEFGGFLVQYPEYIAAEDVPGGRSDPDPSKALKKAKYRPANAPPRPVETLQKLGKVHSVQVVPYPAKKVLSDSRTMVAALLGKPLYPDLVDAARKCKGRREVLELIVTPTSAMTLDEMTDIMGDTRMRREDTRTFPGLKITWYNYHWLEVGIVDGQVKKVRVHCQMLSREL